MKRAKNLLLEVADPDNLRFAAWKAAKGKRHSAEVLAWSARMEDHIPELRRQILSGQVQVGRYRYFKVYEPKERQICAAPFGEQVLHHALMNVCHAYLERVQIFDSYASRKGKGVYAALERAGTYTKRYDWFLKLDVRKFFESIHHEVLVSQLARMFKDAAVVGVFEQIIGSYQTTLGRGLPIGNLTSQYFANHYLNGLDRYIKEHLQVKAYVRYMDDLVLWHDEKAQLIAWRDAVQNYVETDLCCALKPDTLNRCVNGLPFLGYHVFPHHRRLLQKSKQRFIRKLIRIETAFHSDVWSEEKCRRRALPLIAFARHADTGKFRNDVLLRLQGQQPQGR